MIFSVTPARELFVDLYKARSEAGNYGNVGRRLNGSELTTLVAGSWVGTTIAQSASLEALIRSVLETGRTVTFAVKRSLGASELDH